MSMTYYVQSQTITNIYPESTWYLKYILNTGFANEIISLESKVFAVHYMCAVKWISKTCYNITTEYIKERKKYILNATTQTP